MPKGIRKSVASTPAPVDKPKPRPREEYGCPIANGKSQLWLDRWAFATRRPITSGAPLRPELFWRIADEIAPKYFEKHDWTHKVINTLCTNQWVGMTGCSGSAKTHNVIGFACVWWLCAPEESSVILCSTTSRALRKRGWANVQMFYSGIPGNRIGNLVDSRMLWQYNHGDDKHAITGIAVEEGETAKVADNIKGIHTRRQMVIIDEATSVNAAIMDACTNLYSYPEEFILVMVANARSRLDQHGRFCEPVGGWNSIGNDDEEWDTVKKLDGKTGVCIRFDAEKSPNIVSPKPDGSLVSRHLPTLQKVQQARGRPGFEKDPTYWSNQRGIWSPEGLNKSVFSEAALIAGDAYGRFTFGGDEFRIIGALDPARTGGDRIALRFAGLGRVAGGDWAVEMMPPILIPLDASSKEPVNYQVMEAVRRECERVAWRNTIMSCSPENLGVDASGDGAGLVDTLQRTWSPNIMRILFGESASPESLNNEDIRPANEVFNRRRAEMYFRARYAVDSHQFKGWDAETAKEMCTIVFLDDKPLIRLISKEDYRKAYGKSPDLSDTVAMIMEVARRKGFRLAARGTTIQRTEDFEEMIRASKDVHLTVAYEPEEEYEDAFDVV